MLLVLIVHFARIVLPELVAGTPIQPYAVDPTHMIEGTEPAVDAADVVADGDGDGAEGRRGQVEESSETESATDDEMEWIDEPGATDDDASGD
jgi:hypothetical protein